METIRVNMTPCEDVQTIHASQNDAEARQWEFELHNNGELIDTSDVSEQMFFKAYKGVTEQILPENTSTPTTSPFLGDIRYPQGLLTDQEFLYRESPTEEDGLAKITDIKGNTLVWNQQIPIPTRQSGASNGITVTNNGDGSLTLNGTPSNMNINWWIWGNYATNVSILSLKASHKYFIKDCNLYRETGGSLFVQNIGESPVIWSPSADYELGGVRVANGDTSKTYTNVKVYPMIIDLTQMGLDSITSVDEFTSLFPLSYYAYNQGTLLSFNGNGIKTVGKNLFNARETYTENGITFTNDNGVISINGTATRNAFFTTNIGLPNGSYFIGAFNDEINNYVHVAVQVKSGAYVLDAVMSSKNRVDSLNNDIDNFIIWVNGGTTVNNFVLKPMISFDSPEYFEPYTSSTLSLPISTYFPTGMKSAGSVYDELTPTKAITRVGIADLGSLEWTSANTSTQGISRMRTSSLGNVILKPADVSIKANVVCANYETLTANSTYIKNTGISVDSDGDILVYDPNYNTSESVASFKQAVSGKYLYYELATSTETSFTTASLVTENAEIPLSNDDGVLIGKCTEQLSAEPGFHDAKIKLSDGDGECYSNKIQLHIERSPQ